MWDTIHLVTIGAIFLCVVAVFSYRKQLIPYRHPIRLTMGWLLIISRLTLDIWYVATDQWMIETSLPFELCSIASLLCGVMLLTKNKFLFEVLYFISISGAIMAIVTPDLFYGFPQYRYWQFFFDHTLLILAPLFMLWFYRYKLTWYSVFKSFIFLNGLASIVLVMNRLLSANYMFLMEKPSGASLLDLLGPYPYYLLSLEGMALLLFFLLYFPVWITRNESDE